MHKILETTNFLIILFQLLNPLTARTALSQSLSLSLFYSRSAVAAGRRRVSR